MRPLFVMAVIFLVTAGAANAQTLSIGNDTLVWEVHQLYDVEHDTTMSYSCKFITYKQNAVEWIQESTNHKTDFSIESFRGDWRDLSSDGFREFDINYQGREGKLWFGRSSGQLEIRMTFHENGRNAMPFVFHVQRFLKK